MSKAYLPSNSNQTKHICFILNVIHIILLSLDSPSQFILMLFSLGDDLSAIFTKLELLSYTFDGLNTKSTICCIYKRRTLPRPCCACHRPTLVSHTAHEYSILPKQLPLQQYTTLKIDPQLVNISYIPTLLG